MVVNNELRHGLSIINDVFIKILILFMRLNHKNKIFSLNKISYMKEVQIINGGLKQIP